jgi:flagellar basal-body rod protein FlgG
MADYGEIALVSGLAYLAEAQAAIAHNLANVDSASFKRRTPRAVPYDGGFRTELGKVLPSVGYSETIDWTRGPVRPTGERSHLALAEGDFFRVRGPDQRVYYTRQGSLLVDAAGRLMTAEGYVYLDVNGNELVLPNAQGSLGEVAIRPNGTITSGIDGSQVLGQLGVVKLEDPKALLPAGHGVYLDTRNQTPQPAASDSVQQGFLERSNVDSLSELVSMITVERSFEATQRTLTTIARLKSAYIDSMNR